MHTRSTPHRRRKQPGARRRPALVAAALIAVLLGFGATRALYAASVSALVIAVTPDSVVEGSSVSVEVSLTDPVLEGLVTVNVQTHDGPLGPGGAQSSSDYSAVNQTLLFPPGVTSRTVTITTGNDSTDEANEVFDVQATLASAPAGVTVVGSPRSTVVIEDNDGQAFTGFSASAATVAEGAGTAGFSLTLGGTTAQAVRVDYTVLPGGGTAATPGTDTGGPTGTWYIPAGTSSANVTLPITNDTVYEGDESFAVRIDAVTGASYTPPLPTSADVTITDDDPAPTVSVANASVTEGTGGSTSMVFTLSLSNPSSQAVTVNYTTTPPGTASFTTDFTAVSGTATVTAGTTSTTINVPIATDSIDEDDETFTFMIANPSGATLGTASATGTIVDDDLGPAMTINDVTLAEGNSGTTNAVFTVSLASATTRLVTVSYATASGSAAQPADYTSTSGTLQIAIGDTSGTITVPVLGDTLDEADETFTVVLTGASGAVLAGGTASGTGTITDDDAAPTVSVNDPTLPAEGNSGTASLPVTVSLSAASGLTVTVELSTADGTATAPADYTAIASRVVSLAPGETSKTVNLSVAGDVLDEDNETVTLTLANPSNATLGDASGTATITDDDASPSLSVADISVNETDAPANATATFTVQLSSASGRAVTVNVSTSDGTAAQPGDYTQLTATPLTIPAGQTSATVNVTVIGDAAYEGSETFTLGLSGAGNATISDASATATIVDNDRPSVVFSAASSSAGEGAGTASVTVQLSSPVVAGDSVSVAFSAGGASTATAADYTVATASPLTFAPGESSKTIVLNLADDTLDELDETVVLTLSAPSGATLGATASHTLTITDNDAAPEVRFAAASSAVGEAAGSASVTVELSAVSGRSVTVDYSVASGTASGADWSASTPGTLTFPAGVTSQTIVVTVVNDTLAEPSETVSLAISGASGATLGTAAHSLRIDDNDGPPQVLFDITSASAAESGASAAVDVVLTGAAGVPVSIDFAQTGGTAVDSTDYWFVTPSPIVFAPGETRKTVDILLFDNPTYELDRTLVVTLSNLSTSLPGATIGAASQYTLTIEDDDGPSVAFSAASASVAEGVAAGKYTATVQLSQALLPGDSATVTLTPGGSASSPADYSAPASMTLTAADGTSKSFDITLVDNQVDAADKTVSLALAAAAGSNVKPSAPAMFTLTIQDDDETPVATDDSYSVAEDATLTVAAPGVLGNDTDGDGDALSAVKLSDPAHGTLALGSGGSLTYTPAADYNGPDGFTYQARDPGGNLSAAVTVQVTVTPVNDAPVAVADTFLTPENTPLTIVAPGALANDIDVDGDSLTAELLSDPSHGTLTLSSDGALSYVPDAGYKGVDTFSYRVSDGVLTSPPVTSTLRVGLSYLIMAPLIIGRPGTPDLVVSLDMAPAGPSYRSTVPVTFTVTITNTGTGATESGFWVDLYINPAAAPTGPNLPWNANCGIDPCRGVAWYVGRVLQPGESVTLRSVRGSFDAARSIWEGLLPSGARSVYVFVDSWNPTVPTGAIREVSEANNRAERGIQVDGVAATAKQRAIDSLPPRR